MEGASNGDVGKLKEAFHEDARMFGQIDGWRSRLGDRRWQDLLDEHDDIARRAIAEAGGSVIKCTGDGVLATFDGPGRALRCTAAIRATVHRLGIIIRVGAHTGKIELRDDIGGIAVHIAARVGSLAEPDEVLVSSTVKDLVAGSGITFAERGTHVLKGVPDEWRLYSMTG
jgi:class 3 adenylate cyclase